MTAREWPAEPDRDLAVILGQMIFESGPRAHLYRDAGFEIPRRVEDEQTFIMHRMLGFWFEHGKDWASVADAEIVSLQAKVRAARESGANDD